MPSELKKSNLDIKKEKEIQIERVLPFFSENNISVCMVSSEEYSIFISVTINSILKNSNDEYNYDLIVFTTDMSQRNKNLLRGIVAEKLNFSIRFINVNSHIENLKFHTWAHFTEFTYFRLLIPYVLDKYDKIIYLDSDVVVRKDISELYKTDVKGYLLAAVRDTHVIGSSSPRCPYSVKYYKDELGFEDVSQYFQGGVVIYNINEMKKEFPEWKLLKIASMSTFRWLDQDLLNIECKGRVKFLPNHWNVMTFNNMQNVDENYLDGAIHQDYFSARNDPWIIHYVGRSMPCFSPYGDMFWYFWEYARDTPYYEILISTMMDLKIGNYEHRKAIESNRYVDFVNKFLPEGTKRKKLAIKIYQTFK